MVAVIGILILVCCACNQPSSSEARATMPPNELPATELPSFATVIVDFSASFAPLSQIDRLALKETARAIADLAVQDWAPPTTVVWRKIGTASITQRPLCDVIEYKRSIIGAVGSAENLRTQLDGCAESIIRASREKPSQEPYTDISGGIMMSVQNWNAMSGRKVLIILSDFLEDLPKTATPVPLTLQGEAVLLLYRPGTTETEDTAPFLERIANWQARLLASGARSVAILPIFWTTADTVKQALTQKPDTGTSVALVSDLVPENGSPLVLKHAITTLSAALAKQAAEWPSPVTAGWFATARPAWRTSAVAPVVYTPRLVHRANELNSINGFREALEETGLALQQRQAVGRGDVDGALRLITNSDAAAKKYLVLLSDFSASAPKILNTSIRGEHVVMVYRATNSTDGSQFFDRLAKWQEYFKNTGATRVCAVDITTLTESVVNSCL